MLLKKMKKKITTTKTTKIQECSGRVQKNILTVSCVDLVKLHPYNFGDKNYNFI